VGDVVEDVTYRIGIATVANEAGDGDAAAACHVGASTTGGSWKGTGHLLACKWLILRDHGGAAGSSPANAVPRQEGPLTTARRVEGYGAPYHPDPVSRGHVFANSTT